MSTNEYELLNQTPIINILVGEESFGKIIWNDGFTDSFGVLQEIEIYFPKLYRRDICDISTRFGFQMRYEGTQFTRREYFEKMLDHFIKADRCSDLLAFLFGKPQFQSKLSCFPPEKIDEYYNRIVKMGLEKINAILRDSGHEMKIVDSKFVVQPFGTKLEVHAPMIAKTIDRPYIADITTRALQDIDAGHFDSALTKSKTLLEEVFKYVIEQKGETPPKNASIDESYKCVRDLYNMKTEKENDQRINKLISGLTKIISAVSEMRNSNSDAHGLGKSRPYKIKDYYARLIVNASMTLADFILSVAQNNLSQK